MKDISGSARNSSGGDASSEEPLRISKEMLEDAPENTPVDFERGMSYFTPLTLALITANILVFIWQLAVGVLLSKEAIVAAGALERDHLLHGEVWRLFSPMFLHGSFDHLVGNCFALYVLGIASEHAFGGVRTAAPAVTLAVA